MQVGQLLNVLSTILLVCSENPMTGYFRDGYCKTNEQDQGKHLICAKLTQEFLDFTKSKGNDLITPYPQYNFPGLKEGQNWCVCVERFVFGEQNQLILDMKGSIYTQNYMDKNDQKLQMLDENNSNYKQICITKDQAWALNEKGEVFLWRIQKQQEKGKVIKSIIDSSSQRKVKHLPENIVQISGGVDHFLALTNNGEVYSMGDDTFGQCGQSQQKRMNCPPFEKQRVNFPTKINQIQNVKKIVCGKNHSLAICNDGRLYGWGSNSNMQLSQLSDFSRSFNPLLAVYEPILINKNLESNFVKDVAAGEEFTVIVTENQQNNQCEVFSCGHNNKGELGVGMLSHLQDVTKIDSLSNYQYKNAKGELENIQIKSISCGYHHCVAALNIGVIAEWGDNDFGQLGNNKRTFSENPIIMNHFSNENIIKVQCGRNVSAVICKD